MSSVGYVWQTIMRLEDMEMLVTQRSASCIVQGSNELKQTGR
jgi:hypothetical protein